MNSKEIAQAIQNSFSASQPQQLEQQPVEQSEALSDKAELITAIQQLEQSRQRVKLILENDHTATSNFIQIANLLNEHKVKTESIRRDLITRTNKLSCILTEASQSMHEIKQKSSLALLQNI